MSSRTEIEECITEYLIEIGFKQIGKYDKFPELASITENIPHFQVDYYGSFFAFFAKRYFSLVPMHKKLSYRFVIYHVRYGSSFVPPVGVRVSKTDLAYSATAQTLTYGDLAGATATQLELVMTLDFYQADSFDKLIKTLLDSENNAAAPFIPSQD